AWASPQSSSASADDKASAYQTARPPSVQTPQTAAPALQDEQLPCRTSSHHDHRMAMKHSTILSARRCGNDLPPMDTDVHRFKEKIETRRFGESHRGNDLNSSPRP